MYLNRKIFNVWIFILSSVFLNLQIIYAQGRFSAQTETKIKSQIAKIEFQKINLAPNERKVESHLRGLIKKMGY